MPMQSAMIVSSGSIVADAMRRGVTSFCEGSVPSARMASICSVTFMEPSSLAMPLLTIIADCIGMIGGYFVASTQLGLTSSEYWTSAWQVLEYNDLAQGLIKPFAFAIIIALVGCFYGIRTSGGTQGVGRATTNAVVWSSLWIIVINTLITQVFVNF